HVVGTYDGSLLRLYVNGALSQSKSFIVAMNHSLQALRFGGGLAAGDRFDGRLDEVALYSTALSAAQVTARYNATNNVSGLLPTGLALNAATPAISGTAVLPSTAGSFPFRMRATDANGCFGLRDYTLTLTCPAITVAASPAIANGTVGTVYATRTFTASGGMAGAGGYNWTSTALPPGLTLTKINTTQATLTGTPTTAGTYSFTVTATDANNCTGQSAFSNIVMSCPAFSTTNGVLMLNTTGTAYTQTTGFTVSSGNALDSAGYTWSLVSPPAGFTIGSTDGRLTIASTVASNAYNLTVRATPNAPYATCFTDRSVTYRVCPVFTWTPASLPAATVGVNINTVGGTRLTATSSSAIVNYTLSGAPAWLSIDSTGQLQGTPTASAASASFTINATDANGCTG
ncbi:MAG: LamG domain-containing protein, partial [Gemmatimonas sp.]